MPSSLHELLADLEVPGRGPAAAAIAAAVVGRCVVRVGPYDPDAVAALAEAAPGARVVVVLTGDVPDAGAPVPPGVEVLVADPVAALAGLGPVDLVVVTGVDADVLYHVLDRMAGRAGHLLVESAFLDRAAATAVAEFLVSHGEGIRSTWSSAAADAVLVTTARAAPVPSGAATSDVLRDAYSAQYFLGSCGGWAAFRRNAVARLEDPRLLIVAALAGVRPGARVLDLGCGRGELAAHLARAGAEVTAVDYADEAVGIARAALAGRPEGERVEVVQGDVCTVPLTGPYDVVVASDIVEHLAPAELDVLYARVASLLDPQGRFVVHTFPNRAWHDRDLGRRRSAAAMVGAYLPPQPRTRAEQIVHINEQEPAGLQDQLARHLPWARTWVGSTTNPAAGLGRAAQAVDDTFPDVFAVAGPVPVADEDLRRHVVTPPLDDAAAAAIALVALGAPPRSAPAGVRFRVPVRVVNRSVHALTSAVPNPVRLSYHWSTPSGEPVVFDGARTELLPWVAPGEDGDHAVVVATPAVAGRHVLAVVLVQDGHRWLDEPGSPHVLEWTVEVASPALLSA